MELVHIKLLGLASVLLAVRLLLPWSNSLPDGPRKKIGDYAEAGFVACLITLVLITFVLRVSRVEGHSMNPTLQDGQLALINKLVYRFHPPHRGDIVVFQLPGEPTGYIKRVVAVPGDRIEVQNGWVRVNGLRVKEPYTEGATEGSVATTILRPRQVFVMGDNRSNSTDSRSFGPLSTDSILGKVSLILWPAADFGLVPNPGPLQMVP